ANPRLYTTGICREHLLPSSCSNAPATSAVQHLKFLQKIASFAIFPFPSILECWPKVLAFSSAINMSTETNISALHAERLGTAERSTFKILLAVSICHLLNDTVQS